MLKFGKLVSTKSINRWFCAKLIWIFLAQFFFVWLKNAIERSHFIKFAIYLSKSVVTLLSCWFCFIKFTCVLWNPYLVLAEYRSLEEKVFFKKKHMEWFLNFKTLSLPCPHSIHIFICSWKFQNAYITGIKVLCIKLNIEFVFDTNTYSYCFVCLLKIHRM